MIAFPLRVSGGLEPAQVVEMLRAQGFVRLVLDDRVVHIDELGDAAGELARVANAAVIVDRVATSAESRGRIVDAFETAFREGNGDASALFEVVDGNERGWERVPFTEHLVCPHDGTRLPDASPQLFSFNSPRGACETCNGFGAVLQYDLRLIVPDPSRSLRAGAIAPWTMPRYDGRRRALAEFARKEGIPLDAPWSTLTDKQRDRLLHARVRGFTGIIPFLEALEPKKYKQYIRVFLRRYQTAQECPTCGGARLRREARQFRIAGRDIAQISALPIDELRTWIEALTLSPMEQQIADHILREARDRIRFLDDVGLSYLSLDRAMRTLSGGEAQRITLSNALGSQLVDTLYVLDEPTIGLHARDVGRLLGLLHRLRDGGNTVLMVEHDLEAIRAADHMIELGPGSGVQGGHVVFTGPASRLAESPLTGAYATGARTIPPRAHPRRDATRWIELTGARAHTLQGIDVQFPLGALTCVTGVSGSGKSTLVHDVLYRALERTLTGAHSAREHLGEIVGSYDRLTGAEALTDIALIDQEPIGRTPRSNPITYIKAFDRIREIFAATPMARQRRFTASTFSFNVKGGRCDACEGAGAVAVEMQFLADVFVPCEICGGARFKPAVLEVKVQGRNIVDVLAMTVDEAIRFFPREEKLGQALWYVQQVGLGYLQLGQSATTLSGGEAQRLKIARELALSARDKGRRLYIMDEPTTGLHVDDVRKLMAVLDTLVAQGHTLVVIEHNLDVIRLADWIIDLGPEGGARGGTVVAMGTVDQVAAERRSHTGRALAARRSGADPVT